jgi:aspartate kinase
MTVIVQKFGGTSVADIARIKAAALLVKKELDRGNQVVVVVSAMAGTTDKLANYSLSAFAYGKKREFDVVLAAGEQITSGLLALALQEIGINSQSWLGWQLPIITDSNFNNSKIKNINTKPLKDCLDANIVPVIAGFQGVYQNEITTLGRGGSDTTAVAITAALKADRCDIYTDVVGVMTADPRIVVKARKIDEVTYEEMLEMASNGAKVLHSRAVEIAIKYNIKLQILSSFIDEPGTQLITERKNMEEHLVTGITYAADESKILLRNIPNLPGHASVIFAPLKHANVNIDMIVQNAKSGDKAVDLTFTVPKAQVETSLNCLRNLKLPWFSDDNIFVDNDIAKISVIGVGMKTHSGVAQKMFQVLAEKGINIDVVSTSEIKISVLIDAQYMELAVRSLHTAYGLDSIDGENTTLGNK